MTNLDPNVLAALLTSTGAALMMVLAGVRKNALDWRLQPRRCPACGREIRKRTCGCATG
jgi:hypothetical protein